MKKVFKAILERLKSWFRFFIKFLKDFVTKEDLFKDRKKNEPSPIFKDPKKIVFVIKDGSKKQDLRDYSKKLDLRKEKNKDRSVSVKNTSVKNASVKKTGLKKEGKSFK